MTFRPSPTAWFETYTPRNQTVYAIESLANTGQVEFSHELWPSADVDRKFIQEKVREANELVARLPSEISETLLAPDHEADSPEQLAEDTLASIRNWYSAFLRLQHQLKHNQKHITNLEHLKYLLLAIPDHDIDFDRFDYHSDVLYKKLFCCPQGVFQHPHGQETFIEVFNGEQRDYLMIMGTPEHVETIRAATTLSNCFEFDIPDWLEDNSSDKLEQINIRLDSLSGQRKTILEQIQNHKQSDDLKRALSAIHLLHWYLNNLCGLSKDHKRCQLVGWTSADNAKTLEDTLHSAGIDTKVVFAHKPENQTAPVNCSQPTWASPFSFFVNLIGTPGKDEIDPSPILAIIVPLLFGYMFPDIGHGFILILAGFWLRNKIPEVKIFTPCGLMSIFFGLLFGDAFGHHDFVQPLWLSPLQNPLPVMLAPMVFGAVIITTGLIFSAIESYWRNEFGKWMLTEAAVFSIYMVLISAIFETEMIWFALLGLAWYFIGTGFICEKSGLYCMVYGAGSLLESIVRLILNSVSFIRVGAFALAHAGSSYAVNEIANMIEHPVLVVLFLVLGHALIIILEGLIVFVQTSRLILFEFFLRFLKADGRVFHPMHKLG